MSFRVQHGEILFVPVHASACKRRLLRLILAMERHTSTK
ncbi:cell division ATP-binding protein FtsE, partial [Pseudomonas aeruginosa]